MYCRNCSKAVDGQAVFCPNCGAQPLNGNKFCQNCGQSTDPAAEICVKCGVRLARSGSNTGAGLQSANAEKLQSIKTYIFIGWIFGLLALIGWAAYLVFGVIIGVVIAGLTSAISAYAGAFTFAAIIPGIILMLVFALPTLLVFMRLSKMRRAVDSGDIGNLKDLNSTGWAVVALIFGGVIPGIMLLVAHSPIEELA